MESSLIDLTGLSSSSSESESECARMQTDTRDRKIDRGRQSQTDEQRHLDRLRLAAETDDRQRLLIMAAIVNTGARLKRRKTPDKTEQDKKQKQAKIHLYYSASPAKEHPTDKEKVNPSPNPRHEP